MEGGVCEETFTIFFRHLYGCKMDVLEITELSILAEVHSITCQFGQLELEKEVKGRLGRLLLSSGDLGH